MEELKMKLRPKMVVINRELAEITSILSEFDKNNSEDGNQVFTKPLDNYQIVLKFDSQKVMDGLD